MRAVFEYAQKIDAAAVGFIDGDVTSADPTWIRDLIGPVLKGYDHVLPVYLRSEYDGSITNNLIYPVLYGLLGADIRQPLAGEIAVSRKSIDVFLEPEWYDSAYYFGIDVFMVTQSIFNNLKIAQTFIGTKEHKPSSPKLNNMFLQVADSLFRQLIHNGDFWQKKHLSKLEIPTLRKEKKLHCSPEVAFDYKHFKKFVLEEYKKREQDVDRLCKPFAVLLKRTFSENSRINLSAKLWTRIVYHLISKTEKPLLKKDLLALRVLFFTRFLTFYKEVIDRTHKESEQAVRRQARIFRRMRGLAIK